LAHTVHVNGEKAWFALASAGADADQCTLFFYLITPPDSRSWAGVRRFLPAEVLGFMPGMTLERVQEALSALQAADLILYDPQAHLIYTPLVLEMQPYTGHPSVSGAANGLADFPDSPALAPALEHLAPAEAKAAAEAKGKAEAMPDGDKKAKALALAEKMDELAQELQARLARIQERLGPLEGAHGESTPPLEAPSRGPSRS